MQFKPFDGPLELLESSQAGDGYRVTNVTSFTSERDGDKAISKVLSDFHKKLNGKNTMDIVSSENFDLMYSFIKNFSQLSGSMKLKFTKFIVDCVGSLSVEISNGGASDGANGSRMSDAHRQAVSIYVFFLSHVVRRGVNAGNKAENDRKRKEKIKSSKSKKKDDSESKSVIKKWDEACLLAITTMSTISQFNFAKLWPLVCRRKTLSTCSGRQGYFCLRTPRKLTKLEKCKKPPSA